MAKGRSPRKRSGTSKWQTDRAVRCHFDPEPRDGVMMRKLVTITLVAGAALANRLDAAVQSLPFTDHFAYSDGNLYTVAPGVWDASGSTGPEFTVTNGGALAAPSGFAASAGKGVKWLPSGTARRNLVQFTSTSSGTLYASFLLNVQSISGTRLIAYFEIGRASCRERV